MKLQTYHIINKNLQLTLTNHHMVCRDKFSTGVKQDTPASRKPKNNNEEVTKKPNASPECSTDCSPVKEVPVTTTATTTASSQEPVSTTASHQSAQEDTHSEILLPNTADHQQKSQCPSPKMYSSGLENCHEWINEYSQTESDWNDEEEEDYCSYNWVSDIARPRSDWECMRQERYEEMLHLQPSNQDISQLLERKTVSGFLSSDQRSMLDQLMVTRAQSISRTETKKEEKHEESEFTDQTAGSSPPTRSPALQERSRNHHHRRRHCSQHHPSLDMEFIYDLRKHMGQIHQELMELRKAVTSCVNMQIKNQQQPSEPPYFAYKSIFNTKMHLLLTGWVSFCSSKEEKRANQPDPQLLCMLYNASRLISVQYFCFRCGHMCACYDCGLELQCTSGKCPICEDPILDVVRACAYGGD
ncbi:putative Zinc finger, RING/FYVE/PHD-type [Helianthus annuus]|nr:putative Zinc finger, RING/FYVE/PHD-type [Helianthus annuus]